MIELLKENNDLYEITGVKNFHEAGYFGERVNAASGELWNLNQYNPDNLCNSPTGEEGSGDHARETASIFFQVAPKAHLYAFESGGKYGNTPKYNGKTYDSNIMNNIFPNINKLDITAMFTSLSIYGNNEFREDYSKEMQKLPNFCSCFAAGNDGEDSYNRMIRVEEIFSIGGFTLSGKDKKPIFNNNSSYTDNDTYIDFCGPWSAYSYYSNSKNPNFLAGTSIATPWICGMICLVNDFFIDKTGRPLTREKMKQFFIDYSYDLEEKGKDYKSGWGIPVLPNPNDIDISKYSDFIEPDPEPEPEPTPEPTPEPEPKPEYISYIVQKGDNLYNIALKFYNNGNKYTKIMKDNNLTSSVIYSGQKLKIYPLEEEIPDSVPDEKTPIEIFIEKNNIDSELAPYIQDCVNYNLISLEENFSQGKTITAKDLMIYLCKFGKNLNK